MPTHRTRSGRRVTLTDPTVPHQIRIYRPHGARGRHVAVACTCGAPGVETVDGAHDHWVIYNTLAHDETRGPFQRVDALSGIPVQPEVAAQ